MKSLFIPIAASLILLGCSSTPTIKPHTYSDKDSYALNVMKAANMAGLKDSQVDSEQEYKRLSSGTGDALHLLSAYKAPPLGVSSGASLGATAAFWLLSPGNAFEENRIIAWVPKDAVGDTQPEIYLMDVIKEAITKVAASRGAEIEFGKALRKNLAVAGYRPMEPGTCDVCDISFTLDRHYPFTHAPGFIGREPSYLFTGQSDSEWRSRFVIRNGTLTNSISLPLELSKYLPQWVFLYIAPGKTTDSEGKTINFPLLINNGDIKYFISPQL
jgi:hypothetical protein